MNTRCYPRTLEQAFGPSQRSSQCEIVPMDTEESRITALDWALGLAYIAALTVLAWVL